MRQWEYVSKEGEKISLKKTEGKSLQVEGVQRVPELLVSQVLRWRNGAGRRSCWSR